MEVDWRQRAFIVGGVVGAALGLGAAYIFVKVADERGETPEISPGTAVALGLALLGILRQVATIGESGDKKKKK